MKRVLLTGAGGHVARAFIAAHGDRYHLRLFAKTPVPGAREMVVGDVRRREDLAGAARGVDAILHLAALTTDKKGVTDAEYFETNVGGTLNALEAAVHNGVEKFVYGSSVCAVGFRASSRVVLETDRCEPSDGMYGMSKYLSERLCESYARGRGLSAICLRTAMVVPQHPAPPRPSADAVGWCGAVHLDDVVEAYRLALDNEAVRYGVYHIAAEGPHSKFDVSQAKAALGYQPRHTLDGPAAPVARRLVERILRKAKGALDLNL